MYEIATDYTFVHKNGIEENGTFMVQVKKETGMLITSVEVISKTMETVPNQIIYPFQMTMVCNWLTHEITVTGTFCKIVLNFAISEKEITALGVLEYLGHQYKCSAVLSLSEKYFTMTYQEPGEQPKSLIFKFKVVNKCPTIMISGYLPATKWFKVGEFKTELIQNNLLDYVIKHTYNGKEVFNLNVALAAGRMDITLMYDNGVAKKNHLIVEYQPANEASPLAGGNIKMV